MFTLQDMALFGIPDVKTGILWAQYFITRYSF